ncbi:MAG: VOC family protein [Bacteroidetes bacterium]|nr:VOC family protein [Bacteroidota bacterium]
MSKDTNALNWFEIPALDTKRAKTFYESVFNIEMATMDMMGMEMTFFPASDEPNGKVSGALVKGDMHKPSKDGAVIYLNANPDIQAVLDRIGPNGGQVLMPKMFISEEIGYMAFFTDTEGNRLGLHARN